MENLKVDTKKLGDDALTMNGYIKELKAQKDKITRYVIALAGMWEGVAHDTYVANFEKELKNFDTAIANMDKVHTFETTSVTTYDKCEADVNKLIDGITVKEA